MIAVEIRDQAKAEIAEEVRAELIEEHQRRIEEIRAELEKKLADERAAFLPPRKMLKIPG